MHCPSLLQGGGLAVGRYWVLGMQVVDPRQLAHGEALVPVSRSAFPYLGPRGANYGLGYWHRYPRPRTGTDQNPRLACRAML